ncbi:MAG: leucine-rich repeat protein, partial [Bacteroidales bacterium]|nr:leucine-rich repeat protein [Bacteroidales bacterium]
IEYMPELEELSCLGEMSLTGSPTGTLRFADVTHNPKLKVLVLSNNSALRGKLDLSRNPQLDKLDLGNTGLDYPDISRNTALTYVRFTGLKGRLPDFSGLHRLKSLFMEWPEDEAGEPLRLDISSMSELETLSIGGGKYELSDLAKNPHLKTLSCPSCGLKTLDISGLPELESLECWGNMIQSLDVSNNTVLSYLDCSPMDDEDGNNLLAELLLSNRHEIPNVSIDRSPDYIPEGTRIVRLEQYPPNDELWYTTLYGDIIQPYKAKVCPEVNLLSNTNRGGRGVMKFDGTVVSFSEWALYKTPNLRELVIPSGVVSTSYSCFRECQQLRRVVFAPGLRILGDSSLHHNEALEEVILPDTVVSIEKDALSHAYSLRHINLPPNLEKLGRSAFLYCRKLESIVLPATLKSIGIYAFEHDKALTSITCLAPAPPAGGTEMFDDTSECPIYVPAASVEAYRTAPYWNKYAHRIREIEE